MKPFLLPEIWQNSILAWIFLDNPVWNWLVALFILVFFLLLRPVLTALVVRLSRLFRRQNKEDRFVESLGRSLRPALKLLFLTIGLELGLHRSLLLLPDGVRSMLDRIFPTLHIVILCLAIAAIGQQFVDLKMSFARLRERSGQQKQAIQNFYRKAIQIGSIILGIFMILKVWGYDISGLITGLGIGGLALTLAAQDTLSNLLGGVTIMTDRSFEIGDVISTPDIEGMVEHIGLRSSKIRTFAQAIVNVPNAKLSNAFVTNCSRMGRRRIRFLFSVKSDVPTDKVLALIEKIKAGTQSRILVHPEGLLVHIEKFSPRSIDILFQCFVRTVDYETFLAEQEAIQVEIMNQIAAEGLSVFF